MLICFQSLNSIQSQPKRLKEAFYVDYIKSWKTTNSLYGRVGIQTASIHILFVFHFVLCKITRGEQVAHILCIWRQCRIEFYNIHTTLETYFLRDAHFGNIHYTQKHI